MPLEGPTILRNVEMKLIITQGCLINRGFMVVAFEKKKNSSPAALNKSKIPSQNGFIEY